MGTRLFDAGSDDVLFIVDLSGYVFRAYHAIPPLTSPSGEPTNAVLGTVNMLELLLRDCQPKLLAVAMDSRTKTFRKEMYPAYKANRPPPPDDLKQQMTRVGDLIEAFPLPRFQEDGFEADDLIASAVRGCRDQGLRVVIVSADKDLMQLVGDDVILWDTMRNRVFGVEEVAERFGVAIPQIRDVLALMGDTSDNVPGVPSIGPKTAQQLITEYHDIDGIYAHLAEIKRKPLRETLETHREQAYISRDLVTLKADLSINLDREHLTYRGRNAEALRALYEELGFQRHLGTLDKELATGSQTPKTMGSTAAQSPTKKQALKPVEVTCVTELGQLSPLLEQLETTGRLALVPILMNGAPLTATWVGLALSAGAGSAYYVPLDHRYVGAPKQLSVTALVGWLMSCLESPKLALAGHDVKAVMVLLERHGILPHSAAFDSLLAAYLLDPAGDHSLERLAQSELGLSLLPETELTQTKGRKKLLLDEVSVEDACRFAAPRAAVVQALWDPLQRRLEEEALLGLFRDLELPLTQLLAQLEQVGILLDSKALQQLSVTVGAQLVELEQQAHQIAGHEFNVNSPKQLEKLLFDELGLKPLRRTKTSRSTDADTLEALSSEHELPAVLLEIRQLAKLKGTYIDSLPSLINKSTGRLHTRWRQEVAATGRLSSTDPNLQNIPIRSELGRSIRGAFIAPPGFQIVSADYSQIELRVLAHLSQDPVLLDAFRSGQDIHLRTAMEIFEVDAEDVDAELRRRAKAVNFGVIYGQGDSALGKSLGISRMEAGQFIAAYFRRYAGVQRFMDQTVQNTRQSGVVRTLLGRLRIVPDIHSENRARRLAAERIVMNTPIQGTAADLLKLAMLKLKDPVTPGARMLLTVHDELVFEVPNTEVDEAKQQLKQAMENVYPLDVPLLVEVGAGPTWKSAH